MSREDRATSEQDTRARQEPAPLLGLECSYGLYFPASETGALLAEIASLADGSQIGDVSTPPSPGTSLILADGSLVATPFPSGLGANKTIALQPQSRVPLDCRLCFPSQPPSAHDPSAAMVRPDPVDVRLWIYAGELHTGLMLFPLGTETGRAFVESIPLQHYLGQFLMRHGGVLGTLDDANNHRAFLLPHLQAAIDLPNLPDYANASQDVAVDAWLAGLLKRKPHETQAPIIDPALTQAESQGAAQAGWRRPLPERYHRTFEETPFDTCDFCHKPLLVSGARYAIIKLYSEDKVRQELAICSDCGETLRDGYSIESQRAIDAIFGQVPFAQRLRQALDESLDPFEQMTAHCLLCHTPRGQARSHVEYVDCEADEMVYAVYPFAICETCQVGVYDDLSDQTKEIERRFFDEHFGFPPPGSPALERQPEMPAWIVL